MTTRRDVSVVPPQGAYVAKRCPMRVQLDVLRPTEPLKPAEDAQLRMRQGIDFEEEVVDELRALASEGWVFLEESDNREHWLEGTSEALESGAEVIVRGSLPADEAGRRSGRPDLLVKGQGGYLPVDVKHHLTLDSDDGSDAVVSDLASPFPDRSAVKEGWTLRKHKDDAMQLAHYRRMLQAAGFGSRVGWGGIIGKEKQVVWYDLEEPMWQTPAKSDGRKRKTRSTMETYEFEFAFRLDIAAAAYSHLSDPARDLLVLPVQCGDCPTCPWRDHCGDLLSAGTGDPSLLPGVWYRPWRALRDEGITDRAGVAGLDHLTARLGAEGVNLHRLVNEAQKVRPSTPIGELMPRATKQLEVLERNGIDTAGELTDQVDAVTLPLSGAGWLPAAIVNARAALAPEPVLRLPGRDGTAVPRGDVEIDVDMESTNDGVYLWGGLVTDRFGTGAVGEGYHPFATWELIDEAGELATFRFFWDWLTDNIDAAVTAGRSVAVYSWYASAEETHLKRISAPDPELAAAVQGLIGSDIWIDLERVFKASWTTGGSTGLKSIAPLAGYVWPTENAGGGMSIVRHLEATEGDSPDAGDAAREWLLEYNRGDLEAMVAIRDWLDREGSAWPEVPL